MRPARLLRTAWVAAIALTVVSSAALAAQPKNEIIKEYDATTPPKFDPELRKDPEKLKSFRRESVRVALRRGQLALELFHVDPDNPRLPEMMIARWVDTMMNRKTAPATVEEIDRAMPHFKDKEKVKTARNMRTIAVVVSNPDKPGVAEAEIDRFLRDYPKDPSGAMLLNGYAASLDSDPDRQVKILSRLIAEFPDHFAAKAAQASLELVKKLGKPYELAFKDAISGKPVSISGLKGKVIVLDFWATWCGPCVAEMPKMKKLYAEFKDKGVEFIGIDLDEPEDKGGLRKLMDFVAKNEIPWPQHYDGKAWESPVVESLAVSAVPAVFVIDADGKLAAVRARGRLEKLLPEYITKARTPGTR
jgi:thiol-disulfide isomerase/thioredoxin